MNVNPDSTPANASTSATSLPDAAANPFTAPVSATDVPPASPVEGSGLVDNLRKPDPDIPMIPLQHVQGYINSGIGLTIHKLRPTAEELDAIITLIAEASEVGDPTISYAASIAREFVDRLGTGQTMTMTSNDLMEFDCRFLVQVTALPAPGPMGHRFTLVERSPLDQATLKASMIASDTLEA